MKPQFFGAVLAACSQHFSWAEPFSRVVSDNCCVIGAKFDMGMVNAVEGSMRTSQEFYI